MKFHVMINKYFHETSLFEIATDVFNFSQYTNFKKKMHQKYNSKRFTFIKKMKIKHLQVSDGGIFNFTKIYLTYKPAENEFKDKDDFIFDGRIPINQISWKGPYLKEQKDYEYYWLIENMKENIHHP